MIMPAPTKIYNPKTKNWIANTAANRKRVNAFKIAKMRKKNSLFTKAKAVFSATGAKIAKLFKPTKSKKCACKYSGSEPSPKGRGYCAHCVNIGTVKKGTDNKKWIVKKRSTGSKYWAKYQSK